MGWFSKDSGSGSKVTDVNVSKTGNGVWTAKVSYGKHGFTSVSGADLDEVLDDAAGMVLRDGRMQRR